MVLEVVLDPIGRAVKRAGPARGDLILVRCRHFQCVGLRRSKAETYDDRVDPMLATQCLPTIKSVPLSQFDQKDAVKSVVMDLTSLQTRNVDERARKVSGFALELTRTIRAAVR